MPEVEELQAEVAKLRAENATVKKVAEAAVKAGAKQVLLLQSELVFLLLKNVKGHPPSTIARCHAPR